MTAIGIGIGITSRRRGVIEVETFTDGTTTMKFGVNDDGSLAVWYTDTDEEITKWDNA